MGIDVYQHIEAQAQTCVQDLSSLHDMLTQVGEATTNTDTAIAALQQAIANVHALIGQLQAQNGGQQQQQQQQPGADPYGGAQQDPASLPPNPYDTGQDPQGGYTYDPTAVTWGDPGQQPEQY